MIRYIGIDLDDTLLDSNLNISVRNRQVIQKVLKLGIKVVLASGRMLCSMQPYAAMLGLDGPLIAYNGALVRDEKSGEVLVDQPVDGETGIRLVSFFRNAGIHLNVYINDQLYMEKLTEWGLRYAATAGVTPIVVPDLCPILAKAPSHKLLGVGDGETLTRFQAQLQEIFGRQLQFVTSKPIYLEILAPGVSKAAALKKLVAGWGGLRQNVLAIGDAPNDLEMIAWAGLGVAVGNASSRVREGADWVVADHNHDGVAEAICKAVLITSE